MVAAAVGVATGVGAPRAPAYAQDFDVERIGFVLGSPEAPLTVVEFGDFACSACAAFFRDTWPGIKEQYVDSGRVRWVLVPFEIGFRNSEEGARAARCAADQDAFWPMHDALFRLRDEWVGERNPEDELVDIAVRAGLDGERFGVCYDEDPHEDQREAANDAARAQGIRGTPTFLIGEYVAPGAIALDTFVELIESALRSVDPTAG